MDDITKAIVHAIIDEQYYTWLSTCKTYGKYSDLAVEDCAQLYGMIRMAKIVDGISELESDNLILKIRKYNNDMS